MERSFEISFEFETDIKESFILDSHTFCIVISTLTGNEKIKLSLYNEESVTLSRLTEESVAKIKVITLKSLIIASLT